jgi:riboflavin kinase/FMN adenylyltransferase
VVLTVGKLDGVHAGHRHLAAHVQARADACDAISAAIVLHPDPVSVLSSDRVARLTTVDERCARLRAFGVEIVEPLRFTPEIASLSPEVFFDRLEERFDIAGVVAGPDFAFGQKRSGDVSRLDTLAAERGFEVSVVSPIEALGEWISSRRLRSLVRGGDIALARTLMRKPPCVVGTVIHGAARGRELGFPTANLDLTADFVVPANGIYTVRAQWREHRRAPRSSADGVASIGVRPTFDNGARLVEVHLFDFCGDLYGKDLTVDFLVRQRPEERFDSVSALVEQMKHDAELARRHLDTEAQPPWSRIAGGIAGGSAVRVRGRDLADLCQNTSDALTSVQVARESPVGGGAPETVASPPATTRRTVTLEAADDASLLDAWLGHLSRSSGSGDQPWETLRATVYHAGAGRLHALLWQVAAAPGGDGEGGGEQGGDHGDNQGGGEGGDQGNEASLAHYGTTKSGWLEAELAIPVPLHG